MFRRGKRGQITVFVLLAIVILFAFMFLLFMKVFIEKNRYQVMATQQVQDYISQNSLSIYVTSCIDSVSTEAVIRASLQGGMLNFTNKTLGVDYVRYFVPEYNRTVNISIAVIPNDDCEIVRNSPWEYPYPYTKLYPPYMLDDIYSSDNPLACKYSGDIYDFNSGFFGKNQLLRLCDWNGSNKQHATTSNYGLKTCESGTYSNPQVVSVQEEMEYFIEQEIQKCINFTEVLKRSPSNITQAGDPRAFITFGDDGFNVKVQYPFTVTVRGRQPITAFYDFGVDKPIRFKELYDFSYFSLRTDVKEAGFEILDFMTAYDSQAIADLGKTYRNYIILRNKSIDSTHIDIVRIIDEESKIDGDPLIFQFAIKNRAPALDYINEYSGFLEVDIVVSQNETFVIAPKGYDPDDDTLIYSYGGWKEDYDEYFNYSDPKCIGSGGEIMTLEYVRENCSIRINSKPQNFTNSTLFVRTKKDVEYMPSESDMGFHTLNVSITEVGRNELKDWQLVKIFVFDSPRANITATNGYPGISDNIASIEDPYILNGSNSVVGLSEIIPPYNNFSSFVWNDSRGEFEKEVYISVDRNKTLYLPKDVNVTGSDSIGAIKKFVFSRTGSRNITLRVNTYRNLFDEISLEVDVRLCLPYINNTNPSYPYNTGNPYLANHTCCTPNSQYATGVCFQRIEYGANKTFRNYWTNPPSPSPPPPRPIIYQNMPGSLRDAQNDIFNRTFTRNCDGVRGNICNGTALETRSVIRYCNDNNYDSSPSIIFKDERCSGPPPNAFTITYPSPINCFPYREGQTFESFAGQQSILGQLPDGICTTTPQCADPLSSTPFNSLDEKYTCGGLCNGAGSCSKVSNSSCTCDSTCNGGGSSLCDGNNYYPVGLLRPPSDSVMHCEAGNSLYQDACGSCELTDTNPRVCRTPGPGSLTPDPSRSGCTAPSVECDAQNANSAIGSTNNEGCTLGCSYLNCGNYAYDTAINNCRATCSVDLHCASGYFCESGACVENIIP